MLVKVAPGVQQWADSFMSGGQWAIVYVIKINNICCMYLTHPIMAQPKIDHMML